MVETGLVCSECTATNVPRNVARMLAACQDRLGWCGEQQSPNWRPRDAGFAAAHLALYTVRHVLCVGTQRNALTSHLVRSGRHWYRSVAQHAPYAALGELKI